MKRDRSSQRLDRGYRVRKPATGTPVPSRKGRPNRLSQVDTRTIEKMPQNSPDDVREMARAYVIGDKILFAARCLAGQIEEARDPKVTAFDPPKYVEQQKRRSWALVAACIVYQCQELTRERLEVFFRAVADALR